MNASRFLRQLTETFLGLAIFFLPVSKSIVEGSIWIALIAWFLQKIVLREKWRVPKSLSCIYLLFLAVTLASTFQADPSHALTAWRGFFKWFKFLALFFLSFEIFEDERVVKKIVQVFLASLVLTVLNGFYQMFHEKDFLGRYSVDVPGRWIRMQSSFGSPNGLAGYLLVGLPLLFASWFTQNKWTLKSALSAAAVIGSGVAFVSTLSRAAFLALLLSLTAFAVFRKKIAWILASGAILGVVLLVSPALRENFVGSLNRSDITVGERLRFWNATLKMISDRPWTGHGVNSFFYTFPKYAPATETYRGYAHNCYLQMASETGIIGLLLFLVPVFWILWRSFAKPSGHLSIEALTIGLTAFLLQSAVDTHFYSLQQAALFWIFWGMLSASRLKTTQTASSPHRLPG